MPPDISWVGASGQGGRRASNPVRLAAYFLTVAEEGHVGRAAVRLEIAQPPLSQSLRRFEELLGAQLFVRHAKGVTLTPAGRRAVPRARALVESESALRASVVEPMGQDRPVLLVAPEIPDEWVLRWAPSADLLVRRAPSNQAIQALDAPDGAGGGRGDSAHLAVVVAPSVTGRHDAGPIVTLPQWLVTSEAGQPIPAAVSTAGAACTSASPVAPAGRRDLDAAAIRAILDRPVAAFPRWWQPSAHDLLEDELRAAGSRAHPVLAQVPDRTAALVEALSGGMLMLSPTPEVPPGLVAHTLPEGRLPLRLRVVTAADGGGADASLLRAAAREIVSDLRGTS